MSLGVTTLDQAQVRGDWLGCALLGVEGVLQVVVVVRKRVMVLLHQDSCFGIPTPTHL